MWVEIWRVSEDHFFFICLLPGPLHSLRYTSPILFPHKDCVSTSLLRHTGFYVHFHAVTCKCIKSQLGCILFLFQRHFSVGGCDQKCFFKQVFSLGIFKMFILLKDISDLPSNPSTPRCSTCIRRDARAASSLHFFILNPFLIALDQHLCPQWWASAPLPSAL